MSLPVTLRPEATQAAAALDGISQFPELYALLWQDVRAAPIRRHPYVIYYRVLADRVEVFAVLHARRDPSEWQSRA